MCRIREGSTRPKRPASQETVAEEAGLEDASAVMEATAATAERMAGERRRRTAEWTSTSSTPRDELMRISTLHYSP